MAKQIIDVQYVQVLDRLYVFETEPFEIQYGSDVTRVYVVDESYEGFKEINPDAPLKTFNPEAIQAGYPEWYEYVLSVIDSESNSELLAILYDAGLIANESYATLAEIRAINSSQFADAFATASTLTHFDEFGMFTGVKKLPDYMFQGCPNLESITFPESVYKLGKNVLAGCNSLDSVKVDGNNPKYYSPEGSNLIVDKTTRTIVAGCGNSTIPNDVYYIGDYAFANSDLTDIVIPKNIREIGDHAFDGCSALEYAEFESTNPPKIGSDVFDNVQPDFEIDVPEGAEDDYVDAWPEYADLIHGGEPQPHPEDLPDSEFGLESSDITITNSTMPVIIPLVNTHDLPVTYASSDTSVAVVDQSGNVTLSYNNGNVNLTVAFAGSDEYKAKTLTYRVTVAIPQELTDQELGLSSEGISIDDRSETVTLPIINIYNLPLTYETSDPRVFTVDSSGNVTLTYENGSANVTISFAGNAQYVAKNLIYTISVAIPQELSDAELSWSASSATATQAGTFSGVTLTNTHGLAVAYSSSNTNVATIEPTYGHVMVSGNGSTTITAAFAGNAQYKPKTVTYTLTVAIPQVLPDNEFGLESSDITITSNTMPVIIPLVNTHNLPVTYTSDDTSVATVNGNGNVTLTYDNGTAHISVAFAGNSEYQAKTVTYTVNVAIPQELSDQELGLSSEGISIDDRSETVTLPIVNVYNLPLTYTSDDTNIASVDGNGNVTLTYENGRANIYIEFAGNAQYAAKILGYTIDVDIQSEYIIFADPAVKQICVSYWDTDHDDELSYTEAAAVTTLGNAFNQKFSITTFNELQYFTGLKEIGGAAFHNDSKLTSVVLPEGITSINYMAFNGCTYLSNVVMPSTLKCIDYMAFYNCDGLTNVTIPASVTYIGEEAFSGCNSLETINIPLGVTYIEPSTFSGDSILHTINIPESVTYIGTTAFAGTHIRPTIPASVTYIGTAAFRNCTRIATTLDIPASVTYIGGEAFKNCDTIQTANIPASVTYIGGGAFNGCELLQNVKVGMTTPLTISKTTFTDRSNKTLYVPRGCTTYYQAAQYWQDFGSIIEYDDKAILSDSEFGLSSSSIIIDDEAETVTLPLINTYSLPVTYQSSNSSIATVNSSGNVTLSYDTGEAKIIIKFAGNSQYYSKVLIYNIKVNTEAVYSIRLTTNITSSSYNKYTGTVLYSPDEKPLEEKIFKIRIDNNEEITTFDIDNGKYFVDNSGEHIIEYSFNDPTSIPNRLFYRGTSTLSKKSLIMTGCNLPSTTLEIGEGVETIGYGFLYEAYIKKVILPSTINSIGTSAFGWCNKLGSVIINATTPPTLGANAFYGAGGKDVNGNISYPHPLIYVPDESVDLYKAAEGWSDHATFIKPISQIGQGTHYIIKVGTISDGQNASKLFNGNKYSTQSNLMMASLLSTNNDPNFDDSLFWQDVNELYINDKEVDVVTGPTYTFSYAGTYNVNYQFAYANVVPDAMFSYCEDIKSTYMLDGIEKINAYAFNHCQNLESVYLPETVTYIGSYAFYNEAGVSISYFDMTSYNPPILGTNVFGEDAPEVIHVPEERVSYYKEAAGWSDYSENINPEPAVINYVTAAFNVTETPGIVKLYNDSSNIKSIKVDGRLEEGLPPNYDFETTGRHEVKYELKDDTSISRKMFTECYFDELYLPDSITTIGDNALNNQNITELEIPKNVVIIGENLAIHCNKLTSLVIRSEWSLSIGQGLLAFNNTIAGNLTLPQSLRSLGKLVYYSAKKPSYVSLLVTDMASLHHNLACEQIKTQIDKQVRLVDENLNEIFDVVIPEDQVGNPSIAAYAFYKCSRVKTITFNNTTPPTLGTDAFGNMTALTAIYVPKNSVDAYKTAWSNYANIIQAIPDPTVVATVNVNDTTTDVGLVNNSQLNKVKKMVIDGETLSSPVSTYQFDTTGDHTVDIYMKDNTTIPGEFFGVNNKRYTSIELDDTVITIGGAAFRGCSLITRFEVPPLVTTINGWQTFQNCTSLTTVVLPSGFISLGNYELSGCDALANINLPEGMTSLGANTLSHTALTSITIPSTMTNIANALYYCNSLSEITCLATTPPTLNSGGLDHISELTRTIYVPAASVDTYKAASGWSDYASEIQAIPQEGYTINYSIKAIQSKDDPDYYQNILNEWAFTTYDEQTGESNFSKEDFDAVIDSISLDGVKINVETGEELRRSFTTEGLHNVELNLVGPTVPSNIFSSIAIYECHVGEGITTIGRSAFTEGWQQTTGGKLYLPSTITEFQDMPFTMCGAFKLYMAGSTPPVYNPETEGTNLFEGDYYIIFVPDAAVDTYKAHPTWAPYANNIRGFSAAKTNLSNVDFGFYIDDDHIQDYYDATINDPANNTSFGLDYFANSYGVEFTLEYDDTMFTVDSWNYFTVIDTNRWTSASNTYTITIKFNGDDAFNAKTLTYNVTTELPEEEPEE